MGSSFQMGSPYSIFQRRFSFVDLQSFFPLLLLPRFYSVQIFLESARGGSRANLKKGQLVVGALKNFQKLVTRVRCI